MGCRFYLEGRRGPQKGNMDGLLCIPLTCALFLTCISNCCTAEQSMTQKDAASAAHAALLQPASIPTQPANPRWGFFCDLAKSHVLFSHPYHIYSHQSYRLNEMLQKDIQNPRITYSWSRLARSQDGDADKSTNIEVCFAIHAQWFVNWNLECPEL